MSGSSETVWGGEQGTDALVLQGPPRPWAAAFDLLHLCSLFVLLSVVGAASAILVDGLAFGASLSRLPGMLYWWVPPALGIVAAVMPVRQHARSRVVLLLLAGVALLVVLDLLGAVVDAPPRLQLAIVGGQSASAIVQRQVSPDSWVQTLWGWVSVGMPGVSEIPSKYPPGHPRTLAAQAIAEAGAILMALGTVGVVLALRRWVDRNVVFRTPSNDLVAGAVLGWIVAPSLTVMVGSMIGSSIAGALFRGAPLVSVLTPSAVLAALGVLGLAYAFRRPR